MVVGGDTVADDRADMSIVADFQRKSEEYAARILKLQEEYLIPLKEDLADWLKRILVEYEEISVENFMTKLDNGVVVCKLAKLIEEKCELTDPTAGQGPPTMIGQVDANLSDGGGDSSRPNSCLRHRCINDCTYCTNRYPVGAKICATQGRQPLSPGKRSRNKNGVSMSPEVMPAGASSWRRFQVAAQDDATPISAKKMKCWENAKAQSFYARDNVSNFLKWCRRLGVKEAVLFETEDLVTHGNPRNVVLCLLEVARIACNRYSFKPAPGLVEFEREIDLLEADELEAATAGHPAEASFSDDADRWSSVSECFLDNRSLFSNSPETASNQRPDRTPSVSSINSTTSSETTVVKNKKSTSELDTKVMLIAKSFYGRKVKDGVRRLSEGKYLIAGRIVFVRLLKGKHVMVRVGGGWDTLQHFLERHGGDTAPDISPSDLLPMDTRATQVVSRRRSSQINSSPNGSFERPIGSVSVPPLRRCISSTPVSRRSSMSSPEPWASGSSGYSTSSGSSCHRRRSIATTSPTLLAPPASRRRSAEEAPGRHRLTDRLSLPTNPPANVSITAPPSPTMTSRSKVTRYPNYLRSSQHITSKATAVGATKLVRRLTVK